ncbi:MAG TPA: M50 family metallopeptidase [Urbifossiella sp.]|jgi:hypothetical protein|nr:M50 family metallopeptidase [Urbifossiella sp.]
MASNLTDTARWLRTQRWMRTAVHEAGHAVLAIIEGRPFDDIVLEQDDSSNGMMRNVSYRPGDDEIVRITVAGVMAARLARRRWDRRLFTTAHDDLGVVAEFAKTAANAVGLLTWNINATAQYLESNWGSVEAIAAALIRRCELTHTDCTRLYAEGRASARGRKPFGKMGASGWKPLFDRIEDRMRYPNGRIDRLREQGIRDLPMFSTSLAAGRERDPTPSGGRL